MAYKPLAEPLDQFVKRKGGINNAARRGLLSGLEKDLLYPARVARVTTLTCKVLSTRHNGAANNIS